MIPLGSFQQSVCVMVWVVGQGTVGGIRSQQMHLYVLM
jgi:hypothetical protein